MAAITSADVLLANNAEEDIGVILQVQQKFPEVRIFPASPIPKTTYKTLNITADPVAAFRAVNVGRAVTKPTFGNQTVTCKLLDGSWNVDQAAIKEVDDSPEWVKEALTKAAWRGTLADLCAQIWYGTANDAGGFAGIATLYPNSDSENVVDAEGTGTDLTSVYLLQFGDRAFNLAWGHEGVLDVGPITEGTLPTSDGTTIWGLEQKIMAWCGVQLVNNEAGVRICNLEDGAANQLTDTLIAAALTKFRAGEEPDYIFMNRACRQRLRDSRTATNPTGAPAPFPESAFGIPIVVTDSIGQLETALVAAGS